jgi:nucleotide-binding universal stress UspA family protein
MRTNPGIRDEGEAEPRRVLVPLDGSASAEEALPVAAALARRTGRRLHLAAVYEPLPFLRSMGEELDLELEQQRRAQLPEYLEWIADAVSTTHGLEPTWTLLEGSPAKALAEHARSKSVDLIVMTTHGYSGVSRAWLGSVADQLIRRASVPVLLLHPGHDVQAEFRHILVALDGTPAGERVLEQAVTLGAAAPDVHYSLVSVVEPPLPVITRLAMRPARMPKHWQEQAKMRARLYLDRLAEPLRTQGLTVSTQVLSDRGIGEQVHQEARTRTADLIVVGTHGARGVERMLLGSVADKIIRGATQAVLVVPTVSARAGTEPRGSVQHGSEVGYGVSALKLTAGATLAE